MVRTRDPDEHYAWACAVYADHRRWVRPRAHGFEFHTEAAALGVLTSGYTRYTAVTAYAEWPPTSYVMGAQVAAGRHLMRWHGEEVRVGKRGLWLFPPDGVTIVSDCCQYTGVRVRWEVLLRVAEEQTGLDGTRVQFTGLQPISAAAQRQWSTTLTFARRGIYRGDLEPPLLLAAAEQAVAASLLATFPNTTMITEQRRPRDPATPAVARRATAFIDAHPEQPITLTDIAAAARVVPRTLHQAFRRHLDTTPAAYLRRVRLARAHEELIAADLGDGVTVTDVAARWGFAGQHRFAADYRQTFGQTPTRTLRS
ncbi:helix-turn-helix transcriptional regulator [Krasilnikovia sp. MM14-A1004]|uniref:helix-turn-helix transcriptional regulator n=1 Tax=Krasilnikovia sp. MM14-A1004 TaxID=3373541 RepID=UPI00399CED40